MTPNYNFEQPKMNTTNLDITTFGFVKLESTYNEQFSKELYTILVY